MTENEAKIFIQNAMEQSRNALAELMLIMPKVFAVRKKSLGEYYSNLENCKKEIEACEIAVKALEDVQQYRAIGTPDELQTMKEHGGFTGVELANIAAMQMKLKEYEAIGTPEEFQALKDRLIAKKVSLRHVRKFDGFDDGECPTCGESVSRDFDGTDIFCSECGQKLDWSDKE